MCACYNMSSKNEFERVRANQCVHTHAIKFVIIDVPSFVCHTFNWYGTLGFSSLWIDALVPVVSTVALHLSFNMLTHWVTCIVAVYSVQSTVPVQQHAAYIIYSIYIYIVSA